MFGGGSCAKRWLTETRKRSKARDRSILAWFEEHLKDYDVQAITREVVQELRAPQASPYIEILTEYRGNLCVTKKLASAWADRLLEITRLALSPEENLHGHYHGKIVYANFSCSTGLLAGS